MEKKDIDWGALGFAYQPTDYSYVSNYKDGKWDEGTLTTDHSITLSECAGIFHYCQEVFEGLKAYTTEKGDIVCFRPEQNAKRMANSARRIVMPPFPEDRFVDAVEKVVRANAAWVPPFGSGATLYIRPLMIATGNVIGVKPADEYQFRILVTPVGAYYKGGVKPVKVQVSKYDRAAPHGTGNIKAGLTRRATRTTCTWTPRPARTWRSPAARTSCLWTRTATSWFRSPTPTRSCRPSHVARWWTWPRTTWA